MTLYLILIAPPICPRSHRCATMLLNCADRFPICATEPKASRVGDDRLNAPAHIAQRHKWYGTQRWKRIRKLVLSRNPRCSICGIARATQCDHVEHRADNSTFWQLENLRPACAHCNNRLGAKARHARDRSKRLGGSGKAADKGLATALGSTERDILVGRADLFSNLMTRAREEL